MPSDLATKSNPTTVVWKLHATDEVISESITYPVGKKEALLKHDGRKRVKKSHYAPGGKYRSALKIDARFNKSGQNYWLSGIGWLFEDEVVVTAGHLAYDHERTRPAVSMIAYTGYHGLDSVGKKDVEKRPGKQVAVPKAYLDKDTLTHDVAFVKLKKPFKTAQPFLNCDTPEQGKSLLGVVGYPGNKDGNGDNRGTGPFM